MARKKIIPDAKVHTEILRLLAQGGDRAVSFATVAQATGLAGPTLVQRFGSREGMVHTALMAAWAELEDQTTQAEAAAPLTAKGAQTLLKTLTAEAPLLSCLPQMTADFRDSAIRARAEVWRTRMEQALALRLGGGTRGREMAAILFAAWQGQIMWLPMGGKAFRLKDLLKRVTDA